MKRGPSGIPICNPLDLQFDKLPTVLVSLAQHLSNLANLAQSRDSLEKNYLHLPISNKASAWRGMDTPVGAIS